MMKYPAFSLILAVPGAMCAMFVSSSATAQEATEQFPPPFQELGGSSFHHWTGLEVHDDNRAVLKLPGEGGFVYPSRQDDPVTTPWNPRDWHGAFGVRFEVILTDDRPVELAVKLAPSGVTARTVLTGAGPHTVSLPWSSFNFRQAYSHFLSEIEGLSVAGKFMDGRPGAITLQRAVVSRAEIISFDAPVRGRSVEAGGSVQYDVFVGNATDRAQAISFLFEREGHEAMTASIEPQTLTLAPCEIKAVKVRVDVPERVPPGGHERQVLRAIANGRASTHDKLELVTASALGYPNLVHTKAGWDEVRAKVEKYDWAQRARDDYVKSANDWNVPAVRNPDNPKRGDWLFQTQEEHDLMAAGVAYQLTGDTGYAEKVKLFLMRLSDPRNGFPVTRRACHQSAVQEGHFFQHLAMSYDMTIPSGAYSREERAQIDETFRLFVRPDVDPELSVDHQISNWSVSYQCGQLYSALVLQNMAAAQRMLYAPLGLLDQLVYGTLDDGWWYEVSVSYSTWVAKEFSQVALAMRPWGYELANARFPANYRWGEETLPKDEAFGMSQAQWGPIHHNWIGIKRMWDMLARLVDPGGVMFGLNDSRENRISGGSMEIAYYLYRDPAYATIIKRGGDQRDLLYSVPELPEETPDLSAESAVSDNAGVAVLRSRAEGKPARERIQAVLRYGDHGWFHGHFDRTNLVHLSRYGRSFYNPIFIWYGYPNYMYKFYVQSSISKNMVVVDQKMQEPSPSERLLFHNGDLMQAAAVQVNTRWSHPPYGGMTYWDQPHNSFADKAFGEGRSLPIPDHPPEYGEVTGHTETILQRRLMLVTDDYVVLADYVKGEQEHTFESLFQMRGFQGLEAAGKKLKRHTGQWNTDPVGNAQLVTDCDWYSVTAPARASFRFRENDLHQWSGDENRGVLNLDVHTLWPAKQEIMLATAPDAGGGRQVHYTVRNEDEALAEGKSGIWIRGEQSLDLPLIDTKTLELETRTGATRPGTLFWVDARVVTTDGREIPLSQLPLTFENAAQPPAEGKDFERGPIKIAGIPYVDAISAQPRDDREACIVRVDLSGVDAARFLGILGGDYPVGDESERRKTMAVRSVGREARFLTIIEPFEEKRIVKRAVATDADTLRVELEDGRVQIIKIVNLDGDGRDITARITETKNGKILRSEATTP